MITQNQKHKKNQGKNHRNIVRSEGKREMNTFLTRIDSRSRDILNSFNDVSQPTLSDFVTKIVNSGGMGAKIAKEFTDILKKDPLKPININQVVEEAFYQAIKMGHNYVGTEHLLLAALVKAEYKGSPLVGLAVEKANSLPVLLKTIKGSSKVVYLTTHGTDLTSKYMLYPKDKIVERKELDKMFTILLQKHNPNVLLVGEEGVGKEALTEALAQKIAQLDAPRDFMGAYVIDFSFTGFVGSVPTTVLAYEKALKDLANEVLLLNNCIIVIKHLPNLIMVSAFKQFVEFLNSAGARFVVCTEGGPEADDLFSAFSIVEVDEAPQDVTLNILKLEAEKLERFFLTKISPAVLDYVYQKAKSEIKDQVFPQKAIFLLDKACSTASFEETKIPTAIKELMAEHVDLGVKVQEALMYQNYDTAVQLSQLNSQLETKIKGALKKTDVEIRPLTKADVDKALIQFKPQEDKDYKVGTKKLVDLEKRLNQKIIGQTKAVEVVARALVRSQMGLRPKNKPVGNFLFLGPTGVGKTELAKVLAQEAFGDGALIRLDMSDFSEKHTVARLVGAPPGYVGFNEGGELTLKIARKPQSVVLFDEIEKAHPEVLNILLQIMEEGQLTDMRGELYSFSKAVVILTSNLGTDIIHKRDIGYGGGVKSGKEVEDRVMQSVKSFLKPELLNRFDEVVTFRQLEKSDAEKILDLLLDEVIVRLKEKDLKFEASPQVKEFLLEKGFSTEFGARALRRTVEKELLDKIATFLLGMGDKADGGKEGDNKEIATDGDKITDGPHRGKNPHKTRDSSGDKSEASLMTIHATVEKGGIVVKG